MHPLVRLVAVVAALALSVGLVSSCALADSPAWADPAAPTLESLAPPSPAAPPQAPVTRQAPAASNTAADEAAIRQVVQAANDAFNAEDWDTFMTYVCVAKQGMNLQVIKDVRAQRGPQEKTVTALTVNGDTATGTLIVSDAEISVTTPFRMVRENGGWKGC